MRDQHMRGKAAVGGNAEMARGCADVLVAGLAGRALAAADPRIDRNRRADFCLRIRPDGFDGAGDFMPEREGQGASGAHVELLAVAEHEIAVLHVQIGMADAAAMDAHQHFGAFGLRGLYHGLAQGRGIGGERLAVHLCHAASLAHFCRAPKARVSATNPATLISSARAVGAISAAARSAAESTPSDFKLWRSILRRCPNAASVTRCKVSASQASGSARGVSRTTDEVTLGGGTKAEGATSNKIFASQRQPVNTASRPYDLSPTFATIRSATSR